MIDRASIMAWNEQAPWTEPAMVEQDLIICKALVCIFSDDFLAENLAFRGGTALHKLYLQPQIRYSEDIDLVQIHPGPIKPIMLRLGEVLSWMPGKRELFFLLALTAQKNAYLPYPREGRFRIGLWIVSQADFMHSISLNHSLKNSVPERASWGTEYARGAKNKLLWYAARFQRHSV